MEGPTNNWTNGGSLQEEAQRTFYQYGTWAQRTLSPGDLDGDGFGDLVYATVLSSDETITPHIGIVFGQASSDTPVDSWEEETFATRVYGDDWLGDQMASGDFTCALNEEYLFKGFQQNGDECEGDAAK